MLANCKEEIMSHISAFPTGQGQGMTLRDYFAAKLVHAHIIQVKDMSKMNPESICRRAYEMADEMMKARTHEL